MKDREIIQKQIAFYYPFNISSYTIEYTNFLHELDILKEREHKRKEWYNFIDEIKQNFGFESFSDRTDNNPANIGIIYFHDRDEKKIFEFVICASFISNFFCYYVNELTYDYQKISTSFISQVWNSIPSQIFQDASKVLNIFNKYFLNFKLLDYSILSSKVDSYASRSNDLGNATIFNLLFTDNIF